MGARNRPQVVWPDFLGEVPASWTRRLPLAESENEAGRDARIVLRIVSELGANVVHLDEPQPDVPRTPDIEPATEGHAESVF